MFRRTLLLSVTAGWWGLILYLSGPPGGSDWTKELLSRWFGLAGGALETANLLVRKAGHVTYYGVLCGLLALSLSVTFLENRKSLWVAATLAIATGGFDEWRQTLSPNRTGTVFDLTYDCAGIVIAVLIYWRATVRAGAAK